MDQYVPFIVTRWLSFINPVVASSLNELNKQVLLENKDLHYKAMISLFPKMKYAPRISYIKKVKEESKDEDKTILLLASRYELSKREIEQMLSFTV